MNKKIEKGKWDYAMSVMVSMGYELWDWLDDSILFRDKNFECDGVKVVQILSFKSEEDVYKYAVKVSGSEKREIA